MFRIIHPNRWFFWAIALTIMAALFLLWNIQEAEYEFEDQALAEMEPNLWKTYASQALGLSVRYPPSWQIEFDPRQDGQSFSLENAKNFSESIVFQITELNLEPVLRSSLKISSEKTSIIDGENAQWIYGKAGNDPATSNVIILQHKGKLYYMAGSARNFETIVHSIKFIGL